MSAINYHNFQPDNDPYRPPSKRRLVLASLGLLFLLLLAVGLFRWASLLGSNEITVETDNPSFLSQLVRVLPFFKPLTSDKEYIMPKKEAERLDILLLGMRGKDDPDGGRLTDTIMLFSFDTKTKKSLLVSIPRDLYLRVGKDKMGKANEVYERLGLDKTKELFSQISGVYIDHIVVFDFTAFIKIIDAVGGVDITLAKPFEEPSQWGYPFSLPAGSNHLNGTDALYYVRSRYASNDFDRAERQQRILLALKKKLSALNLLEDPLKILEIINTVRKNIQTSINLLDTAQLLPLARDIAGSSETLKKEVLTSDNLLYESKTPEGIFILLPLGDSFKDMKAYFHEALYPAPGPSGTPPKQ